MQPSMLWRLGCHLFINDLFFFQMDLLTQLVISFTTFFVIIYTYFYLTYKYWEKRKFPFLTPKFPLGNSGSLIKKSKNFDLESMRYYDQVKEKGYKFAGIFTVLRPVLVVIDPEYIKDILMKVKIIITIMVEINNQKLLYCQ